MKMQAERGNVPAMNAKRSTFYGGDRCPDIGLSRKVLDLAGINYIDVHHFHDKSSSALARLLRAGKRSIPMVMCPDTTFSGKPSEDQLIEHSMRRDEALHEKDTPN